MGSGRRRSLIVLWALLAAGTAVVAAIVSRGISAREEPLAVEAFVAGRLRQLSIPWSARSASNPVAPTAKVLATARAHFADHCALCHANDGSGRTTIGKNLYPKAPDMRAARTQALSDGEIFYIIRNGVRWTGMPAWAEDPSDEDEESWGLVHFIRSLPRLTEEDLREMRRLNPKTPHEIREEEEIRRFLGGAAAPGTPGASGDEH